MVTQNRLANRTQAGFARLGLVLSLALAVGASGCATKKFVNTRVDPLQKRVDTLEGQTKEQAGDIQELEQGVSRADEKAVTAQQKADAAAQQAQQAGQRAGQAQEAATNARGLAEKALNGVDTVEGKLSKVHNYSLTSEQTVLFDFESSKLTDEAMQALDQAATSLKPGEPFVIEVRGFTDTSGSDRYNLMLSERRADAVVRYLITKHNIPLYRIHLLGLGGENPVADNQTRDGRRQNRRVEIKVYVVGEGSAVTARR